MPDADLVARASRYAIEGHKRIDQRRRYTGQPYDVHLRAVADVVSSVTDDPALVAAAWLHDILEDTPATFEDLEREFGSRVARLVLDVTDVSRPSDGNRAARKALDRAHLARAAPEAQTIKLADLIDNCPDICRHDPSFARVFVPEAAALLEVLEAGDARLRERCRALIVECAERLQFALPEIGPPPDEAGSYRPLATTAHAPEELARLFGRTFTAWQIARPLPSFDADRSPAALAAELDASGLRIAGLRRAGVVVGYVRRDDLQGASATETPMREFRPAQVLPAEAPLADVVHVLTRSEHCFVTALGGVAATITRAEIQSPIVRMWLFGMITLFEMDMVARIEGRWPAGAWEKQVSPARLEKARQLLEERRRRGQEPTLLDCLQFSDKMLLLLDDPAQLEEFGFASKAPAKRVVRELESLRNNLAHSQDIVLHDWPQIARLAQRVQALGARRG